MLFQPRSLALASGLLLMGGLVAGGCRQEPAHAQRASTAGGLSDENYRQWLELIRPSEAELKWRKMRWHRSLSAAAVEARRLQRPLLLWTMNGHPCGET